MKNKIGHTSLLLLSVFSFIAGITLPMVEIRKFIFFTDEVSILRTIYELFQNNDILLGIIILLFTVIFPVVKYYSFIHKFFTRKENKLSGLVRSLGKWSMLDVFVLALLIVIAKSTGFFVEVTMGTGAYFFIFSVITSLYLSHYYSGDIKTVRKRKRALL